MAWWSRCRLPLLALLLAVYLWRAYAAAGSMSATFDEIIYPPAGLYYWQTGDFSLNYENPPLAKLWMALPLLARGLRAQIPTLADRQNPQYEYQYGLQFFQARPAEKMQLLRMTRMMNAAAGALLALLAGFLALRMAGPDAGLGAVALITWCPNLLAYGSVATTEMPLTLFWLATVGCLALTAESGKRGWLIAGGICLGLALGSKSSALGLAATVPLLWGVAWLRGKSDVQEFSRMLLWVFGLAGIVLVGMYHVTGLSQWWQGLKFDLGMVFLGSKGHLTYWAGNLSPVGWWYFFPVVLLLKMPLALVLTVLLAVVGIVRRRRLAQHPLLVYLWVAVGVLLLTSAVSNYQTGIRLVLPLLPLLYVIGAVELRERWQAGIGGRWLVGVLLGWLAMSSLLIHPCYIGYFNELAGGTRGGMEKLIDCNCDWGQDLPALRDFLAERGNPSIILSYFGNDDPADYGIHYMDLAMRSRTKMQPSRADLANRDSVLLVVSATNRANVYYPENPGLFSWLETMEPLSIVGSSFYVYEISDSDLAKKNISELLGFQGRNEDAAHIKSALR